MTPIPTANARPSSRDFNLIALAIAVIATMPFAFARYPQLVDYPSHLARFAVMLRDGTGWIGDQYYDFNWSLKGNLGADLLAFALGPLIGIENAGFLIAVVIPFATVLGIFAVARALGRPGSFGAMLALPFVYTQSYLLGFLNFALSVALALLAFAWWIARGDRSRWPFVPVAFGLWVCHVSGWAVFCLMVGGFELAATRSPIALARKLWPAAAPITLFPLVLGAGNHAATQPAQGFGKIILDTASIKIRAWVDVIADTSIILDICSLTLIVMIFYWCYRSGRARFDRRAGYPAILLAIASLVLPPTFGGGDYADARLVGPSAIMFCLALDWAAPFAGKLLVLGHFLIRLAVTSAAWSTGSHQAERDLQALSQIPPGARILNVVAENKWRWRISPYLHLSGYAVVRKGALVNSNFAIPGVHLMTVTGHPEFVDPSQRIILKQDQPLNLGNLRTNCCDYVWAMTPTPRQIVLPPDARIVFSDEHSVLARITRMPASPDGRFTISGLPRGYR